jgi:hypothetical protein
MGKDADNAGRGGTGAFFQGLFAGLGAAAAAAMLWLVTTRPEAVAGDQAWRWISENLGYSLVPFALTLVLFQWSLSRLKQHLRRGSPLHQVAQADTLSDIWIGLFFGIGVLWTAIGMRSALLFALGDGVEAVSGAGASGLLERLVRGGILTALSTTIVGGAGGYLLRLYKALFLGARLKRHYAEHEQQLLLEIRDGRGPQVSKVGPCL